ncbi:MAG TPA: anti-sigma factor RsbA family regulatory protein [Solirubrobacterales bacterium]|nr:anti-sigma factor RsbA family regulatory protein [Solirubrobacterales bacterium]
MTVPDPTFSHQLAFYEDADTFLGSTVPYLREGLELGEPLRAALTPAKIELLRGELGADAEAIEFVDVEDAGRNPARLIPAWQDFLDTRVPGGGIRGIGEPIWPARSPAAVDECERHESLLNLAFHDVPATAILCCYDSRALDDDVLDAALLSHPQERNGGTAAANPEWDDHRPEPFAGGLAPPPLGAFELGFDRDTLHMLRAAIGLEAAEAGLSEQRAGDVVLAAAELAANSVVHGGGQGTATIWREPQALVVEVRDEGRILQPLAGRVRPTPTQENGRGLWVANQVCDLVQIRSGQAGTRARLWMNLA